MFGIELRRKGSVPDLYKDVATVLEKAGIKGNIISTEFQRSSIAHSIQKMLNNTYFNICVVNDCAKVAGIIIPQERKDIYSTQHCVNWAEMLPDYRQVLIAMILDDFSSVLNSEHKHEEKLVMSSPGE